MAHEIVVPSLHRETRLKAPVQRTEKECSKEISHMKGLRGLIVTQSEARLYPYTGDIPLAHARISENNGETWTVVQIEGIPSGCGENSSIPLTHKKGGFLAYTEVNRIKKPDEEVPVLNIDSSWFLDSNNRMQKMEPEDIKGKSFFHWATKDRTLLDPGQLQNEFARLESKNIDSYAFPELCQLVSIAKALTFKGDDVTAEKVLKHAENRIQTEIRIKDKEDIAMIKALRPPPVPRWSLFGRKARISTFTKNR